MKLVVINVLVVLSWCGFTIFALPDTITIGGVFDEKDKQQQLAFNYAVGRVNIDQYMLGSSNLVARTDLISADDSFSASKKVCTTLRAGVAGIFGPSHVNTANHIQSICDSLDVPHIETRWDYKYKRDAYSINLHPYPPSLSQAYYDILKALNWKSFVVLFDSGEALVRIQTLLKNASWQITLKQLNEGDDYRPLLKMLKNDVKVNRIVVDVAADKIFPVLKQAAQVGLMTEYYSYFITSLDFNQVDLEDFRHGNSNITGIQLVDPHSEEAKQLVEDWKLGELRYGRHLNISLITTEAALIYDAVLLFATALTDLDKSKEVDIKQLYCEGDMRWQHGDSLINHMKLYPTRSPPYSSRARHDHYGSYGRLQDTGMGGRYPWGAGNAHRQNLYPYNTSFVSSYEQQEVRVVGLTGLIKFDTEGFRSDFQLDILEMENDLLLKKVGTWTKAGANFTRSWVEAEDQRSRNLKNKTLIVSIAKSEPYIMLKADEASLKGNDRFEGFCIDIIKNVSSILGFNYTFIRSPGDQYGGRDEETGEWDGIVRELLDHRADLGIVDLTITYEREEAIDFSMPFMNLGIGIIYKKPQKKSPSLFSFMSPFSIDVWIYMATAFLGVSVLLFILARIAPNEWDNPHPCIQDPEELENTISLSNAFWFTIGSLMQQGSDIAPKAVSTRIVAGIWWFFTLIMISSYTANLAAFLTVERMDSPIEGAEDLAKQTKIKYGSKFGGSTYSFFKDSSISTYQRMWTAMNNARPSVFTQSNNEGVERVSKADGQYAFLMESSSIEYQVERRCDLMQIGSLLDSKSYGIALPPGSPWTGSISSAILKLKEDGVLHNLKMKWWKERKGGGKCVAEASSAKSSGAAELGLANVGGVFVVLIGGMAIAAVMAVCEFTWNARKLATDESASFCEELGSEVKFIMKCSGNTKPVRKKSPSTPEEPLFTYGSYGPTYGYSDRK